MVNLSDVKIVKSKRRSIVLHMLPDGTFEVRAPLFIPNFVINNFIKKNSDWIEKQKLKIPKIPKLSTKYINGRKMLYMGKEYEFEAGNYLHIQISGDKFLFPQALMFRVKKEIENWYIKQARVYITEQVRDYAIRMKTSYLNISFSNTKSKWGSCTHDNRLQFNWKLIMAPLLVSRYVVIHELAHTMEKNHSRKFWSKVAFMNPSYKEQIKWLKINGGRLIF